jgi:hypothetical protein
MMKVTSLSLNSLLVSRGKSRIFGNIDTSLIEMNASEIVFTVMKSVFTPQKIQSMFERDDVFFSTLKRKSGHTRKV